MKHKRTVVVLATAALVGLNIPASKADPLGQSRQSVLEALRVPKGLEDLDRAIESFQLRNYDQCFRQLEAVCTKRPDLLPARFMLAQLYFLNDQLPEGRAALEQATAENVDHPENYLLWGTVALQEDRTSDAAVHFEKAVGLVKSGKWSEERRRLFLIDYHAGMTAVAERRKDWATAKTALSAWLALAPKQGGARQRLGAVLFRLEQPQEAYEELLRAAQDEPGLEPAAIFMAKLYTERKDLSKAASWMETALKQGPNDPKVLLGYATWLLDQNQAEQAKSYADAVAKLDPDSADIKGVRGLIAWHLKHYEEAENLFQALFLDSPGNFPASNQLVLALIEQPAAAKRRRALQLAEMNARLYPKSGAALGTLGWVYFCQGKLEEAEQTLSQALAAGSTSPEIAYFLGRVLAERGSRAEEARRWFKAALDASGRFAFRKEAEEWLERLKKQS
jgi:tetratricopeptide (TPR) repeat protein